jgi:hypothetical protein
MVMSKWFVLPAAVLVSALFGCDEESTPVARVVIESPLNNEVVTPESVVRIRVENFEVKPPGQGKLSDSEGHLHVSSDANLIVSGYKIEDRLEFRFGDIATGPSAAGPHSLKVTLHRTDHSEIRSIEPSEVNVVYQP